MCSGIYFVLGRLLAASRGKVLALRSYTMGGLNVERLNNGIGSGGAGKV